MTQVPDDNLDHYTLGFHAPRKGLRRQDCPYAEGTDAHAQWIAGYDAAVKAAGDGSTDPVRG
ncbi:Rmf/CrpP family protein [Methylobacterium sp. J-090]|uniref:ribosome modulation factor n=1 Tax=Methylobacterium sp. J-090 TaxID=2836666 RepID=UPI001FB93FF3|nr:Rmf/CrpP family protein [Methylobacterium sp. J-090]MCJ2082246.1 ribosome modulation factor [Methylobacterium sp. J-090]